MRAKAFLQEILIPVIHKSRAKALSEVVLAAIQSKTLVLATLGRSMEKIQERSGIQKVNRILGNRHLQAEVKPISASVSRLLIGNKKYPEIIVDWSKYPNGKDGILRAALATEGRALTLYEERHPFKKMGNRKIHKGFLETLKEILPGDCKPLVITDAGFHNNWFKDVVELGWDYVGRVRGMKKCSFKGEMFQDCKKIFKIATEKVKYLGEMIVTKQTPFKSHLYLVKSKLKGRKVLTKGGKMNRHKDSRAYARANREPWLLASSLRGRSAAKKVQYAYKRRMTIEEAFRDLKSSQYGLGLEKGKTVNQSRRNIWLLIAMLANLTAWLTGYVAEKMKLHYQFQSNSIKNRRVISLFYLGCRVIRRRIQIPLLQIWGTLALLQKGSPHA